MAMLDVPNRYLALAPVIVTSPTSRCGTTLVQRLLSASDNAFIYGEEVGHQIKTMTTYFVGQLQIIEQAGDVMDAEFADALAGTLKDWRPGLTPPASVMTKIWVETYYQMPFLLENHTRSIGRPVWGFKHPSYDRTTIKALLSFMPRTKVVYVFRSLFDALSSAKARKFVNTQDEVAKFCSEWARNMSEISEFAADQRVLFVKYEDMIFRKDEYTELLSKFTGAENVDRSAFDSKINTHVGSKDDGHSPTRYIAPAKLTEADRAAVLKEAGPIMERLYGDQPVAA